MRVDKPRLLAVDVSFLRDAPCAHVVDSDGPKLCISAGNGVSTYTYSTQQNPDKGYPTTWSGRSKIHVQCNNRRALRTQTVRLDRGGPEAPNQRIKALRDPLEQPLSGTGCRSLEPTVEIDCDAFDTGVTISVYGVSYANISINTECIELK
jgi:hypothetical protein